MTTVQTFKTIQLPRLVRGKPGAWEPAVCLDWANRFLSFLKEIVGVSTPETVWRVKFKPKEGITVERLDGKALAEVSAGEDRVGFLPQWYWDERRAK